MAAALRRVAVEFPEIDRAEWFALDEAAAKILKGQRPILEALAESGRASQAEARPGIRLALAKARRRV